MDDQQQRRRASVALPRFAQSGTLPGRPGSLEAARRPERRNHA
jgi:hypothetical protein